MRCPTDAGASPLIVVVGPTASGKSALGLELAAALDGEIVSADSMQVYRHFDIGTGKLPLACRRGIAHHLIDVVEPSARFSAAEFVRRADEAIRAIRARGGVVVVVGGTGLYVRALLRGLFEAPAPDPARRAHHERVVALHGIEALRRQLEAVDPEAAASIDRNDFVRVSRALEVYEQTGQPASVLRRAHAFAEERYPARIVGLHLEPTRLRAAIDARVDQMLAAGWLDEVRELRARGYAETHPMGSLGYKQLNAHLEGELAFDEAVRQTKRDTWRFSRRQRNWFSHEQGITWIQERPREELVANVLEILGQRS